MQDKITLWVSPEEADQIVTILGARGFWATLADQREKQPQAVAYSVSFGKRFEPDARQVLNPILFYP